MHCGASIRVVGRPQAAAMSLDDRPANGQAETQPVRFGGHEWFEYPFEIRDRYSCAPVDNGNLDVAICIPFRSYH